MPSRRAMSVRGVPASLAVFVGYAVLSALLFGLTLATAPPSSYIGDGADPALSIWSLAWWPHAIAGGLNPIVTHVVWSPDGINLMWVASLPGLAIPFAPVTLLVGPIAAYHVVVVLVPSFAGWTAFLLCRHLTRAFWPSAAGGLLFGMSSFELKHTALAHLNLTAAGALVPLVALVVLRFLDGELGGRGLASRLGVLVALELALSLEMLFTTALALAVTLALGFAFAPGRRRALVSAVRYVVGGYLVAGVLAFPLAWYVVTDLRRGSFTSPKPYVADALSFFIPTNGAVTGAGGVGRAISAHLSAVVSTPEAYATYLGLPVLPIVLLFARRRIGTPGGRFLLASFAAVLLAEMGPRLIVDGHRLFSLPWRLVYGLPLFDNVLPVRLGVYSALAAAVIVAVWTAEHGRSAGAWLLTLLAVAALVPNPHSILTTAYRVQPFFTEDAYSSCLDPGETILPLPIGQGEAMLWQAESGFRFKLAGGFTGLFRPRGFLHPWSVYYVTVGYHLEPPQARYVRTFVRRKDVQAAVVDGDELDFFRGALDRLAAPRLVGGVALYDLSPTAPACAAS